MRPGVGARMERHATRMIRRRLGNVVDVTVSWQRPVTGSAPQDPALEATVSNTETVTKPEPAFVHFVEPVKSYSRQFSQIETGDVILDFLGDVDLPRDGAHFVINGERYVQKDAGKELTEYWDMMIEGRRHLRTVLATKAPGSVA